MCKVENASKRQHVRECTTTHIILTNAHIKFCDQTQDSCKIALFQVTIVVSAARKGPLYGTQKSVNERTVFVPMRCFHPECVTYFFVVNVRSGVVQGLGIPFFSKEGRRM